MLRMGSRVVEVTGIERLAPALRRIRTDLDPLGRTLPSRWNMHRSGSLHHTFTASRYRLP